MIVIYRLFPDVLNLNGDAANALVLAKRLAWYGSEARVVDVSSKEALDLARKQITESSNTSILVGGHGSIAAMKSLSTLDEALRNFMKLVELNGVCAVLVGSATSWSQQESASITDRVSEFRTVEFDQPGWPEHALGYLNSDLNIPVLRVSNNVVSTLLHGPFLAKNPKWADALILRLGVTVHETQQSKAADQMVEEIWKLESKKRA